MGLRVRCHSRCLKNLYVLESYIFSFKIDEFFIYFCVNIFSDLITLKGNWDSDSDLLLFLLLMTCFTLWIFMILLRKWTNQRKSINHLHTEGTHLLGTHMSLWSFYFFVTLLHSNSIFLQYKVNLMVLSFRTLRVHSPGMFLFSIYKQTHETHKKESLASTTDHMSYCAVEYTWSNLVLN